MPKFQEHPRIIEAVPVTEPTPIQTFAGTVTATPGDWIITKDNGEKHLCPKQSPKQKFELYYKPLDEESHREWQKIYGDVGWGLS